MGDNTEMGTLAVTEELHAKQQEAARKEAERAARKAPQDAAADATGEVACRCPIEFRHQVARLEPGTLGRRQYDTVEPENRLGASSSFLRDYYWRLAERYLALEGEWEPPGRQGRSISRRGNFSVTDSGHASTP
jgi:hypothetical protein